MAMPVSSYFWPCFWQVCPTFDFKDLEGWPHHHPKSIRLFLPTSLPGLVGRALHRKPLSQIMLQAPRQTEMDLTPWLAHYCDPRSGAFSLDWPANLPQVGKALIA